MTLDEAIETLDSSLDNLDPWGEGEIGVAVKLGIEALKRIKLNREKVTNYYHNPLPGETEE